MTHEKMKIYCQSCREYCLDATDEFLPGGPYNGAMFAAPEAARYNIDPLIFQEWMVHGDLFCPRCDQQFILPSIDGEGEVILTEYGLLEPGMTTIDKTCSIINEDFSLQSMTSWNPGDGSTETPGEMDRSRKTAPLTEEPTSASGIITTNGGPVLDAIAEANKTGVPGEIVERLTEEPDLNEGLPPGVATPNDEDEDDEFGFTTGLPPGVVPEKESNAADKLSLDKQQPETAAQLERMWKAREEQKLEGLLPSVPEPTGFPCRYCGDIKKSAGGRGSHERTCPGKAV